MLSMAQLSLQDNQKKLNRRSTVVSDVFSKKGGYGKFARNWFGRTNSGGAVGLNAASAASLDAPQAREESVIDAAGIAAPVPVVDGQIEPRSVDEEDKDGHIAALRPKLLRSEERRVGKECPV